MSRKRILLLVVEVWVWTCSAYCFSLVRTPWEVEKLATLTTACAISFCFSTCIYVWTHHHHDR